MNYTYTISVKHGHSVKTDITSKPNQLLCLETVAAVRIGTEHHLWRFSTQFAVKWQKLQMAGILISAFTISSLIFIPCASFIFFFNFLGYDQKENRSIWIFLSDNRFIQNSLAPYFFCKNFPDNI